MKEGELAGGAMDWGESGRKEDVGRGGKKWVHLHFRGSR